MKVRRLSVALFLGCFGVTYVTTGITATRAEDNRYHGAFCTPWYGQTEHGAPWNYLYAGGGVANMWPEGYPYDIYFVCPVPAGAIFNQRSAGGLWIDVYDGNANASSYIWAATCIGYQNGTGGTCSSGDTTNNSSTWTGADTLSPALSVWTGSGTLDYPYVLVELPEMDGPSVSRITGYELTD